MVINIRPKQCRAAKSVVRRETSGDSEGICRFSIVPNPVLSALHCIPYLAQGRNVSLVAFRLDEADIHSTEYQASESLMNKHSGLPRNFLPNFGPEKELDQNEEATRLNSQLYSTISRASPAVQPLGCTKLRGNVMQNEH